MELIGKRLMATQPGRYYQFLDCVVIHAGLGGIKPQVPEKYWMDVRDVTETTLTYDSFIIRPDGDIQQLKNGRVCNLADVLDEIEHGFLEVR